MRCFTLFPHTDLRTQNVLYTKAHFGRVSTGRMCVHTCSHMGPHWTAQPSPGHFTVVWNSSLLVSLSSAFCFFPGWEHCWRFLHMGGQHSVVWWGSVYMWMCMGIVGTCMCACTCVWLYVCECAQSCLTLCNPINCSPPGSSIHGILQARIL